MKKINKFYWNFKFRSWLNRNNNLRNKYKSNKPRCFIFLAADYGNLGDVAITFAQKKYLSERLPNHEVIEVPCTDTISQLIPIKKSIQPEDIITVIGGGNMGDLYFDIELLRLLIVRSFNKNQIILFPQTINYSNSKEAHKLLKHSKRVYSNHQNLIMCARESISYGNMMKFYPNVNIKLTPDIVMSLDYRQQESRENSVLLCLRNDAEIRPENQLLIDEIENYVKQNNMSIERLDTHIGGNRYSEKEKYLELDKLLKKFATAKLVITDRLHGMIFAFITGTSAIVLPNNNFKVGASYDWVKDFNPITFCETTAQFHKQIRAVLNSTANEMCDNFEEISYKLKAQMQII